MTFIDTNVFVYLIDGRDPFRQARARAVIAEAFRHGGYVISGQVLNEFANVAMKKLGFPIEDVRQYIRSFSRIQVVDQKVIWTDRALQIKDMYGTQFYDSLLLAAGEATGCDFFLSEDLNDGQIYCGMKVVNPFKRKVV